MLIAQLSLSDLIPIAEHSERKLSNYIQLPSIISDNMLIQAEQPVNIWGKSSYVGENIIAEIYDENNNIITQGTSVVNDNGRFSFSIPAAPATRNCTLKIYTDKEEVVVSNVLIGELWLMGGQSNMGLTRRRNHVKKQINRRLPCNRNQTDNRRKKRTT